MRHPHAPRSWIPALVGGLALLAVLACSVIPGAAPTPTSPPPTLPPVPTPTTPAMGGITLVNQSGQTVCYVYISPVTDTTWGDDQLGGSEVIETGSSRTFDVAPGAYDLRADDCNRTVLAEERGITVTPEGITWTLTGSAAQPPPPSGGSLAINLVNNLDQAVCYVYIRPGTSTNWGADRLGSAVIAAGTSQAFNVDAGTYDFRAEDCSRLMIDEQLDVLISQNSTWTINVHMGLGSGGSSGGTAGITQGGTYTPGSAGSLRLVNNSGSTVCYVYISPTTDTTWGADQLDSSETVANGNSRTFSVTQGMYDLRADDCSHAVLNDTRGVQIGSNTTWTIGQ
jgi:hypothetical protein